MRRELIPNISSDAALSCPSAPADAQHGTVFGVVRGNADAPQVAYLEQPMPVTAELQEWTHPAAPNEVLRIAAPCAERACLHFDGASCRLIARIVDSLPPAVAKPPPCAIRTTCRWWKQEGRDACIRCPRIVTQSRSSSALFERAVSHQVFQQEK